MLFVYFVVKNMTLPKTLSVTVNAHQTYQTIDGFGVNINSKAWQPRLMPAMELLLNDLGATLYRVDIFGKSNWIDPDSTLGRASLAPAHLEKIYQGEIARCGWEMIRYLNARGIAPYLTASGDVPTWMLAPDGKTLADTESFGEMLASLVDWAVNRESLQIAQFGPLNETDLGSPEGPTVSPEAYPRALEIVQLALAQKNIHIPFIVPEQANFNPEYIQALTNHASRFTNSESPIFAFSTHCYANFTPAQFDEVRQAAAAFPEAHLWMGEYGDLEQSGEQEWPVAWAMTSRLFDLLENGYHAALVWDAYDNYHDHDEPWTIYGLIRTGLRAYTPKKRYYAQKQVFRFVRPGFQRIAAVSPSPEVRLLAFASPDRTQLAIIGMNASLHPAHLNVTLEGFPEAVTSGELACYRTSEQENCHCIGAIPVRGGNWPFTGVDVSVPPETIFTLTL